MNFDGMSISKKDFADFSEDIRAVCHILMNKNPALSPNQICSDLLDKAQASIGRTIYLKEDFSDPSLEYSVLITSLLVDQQRFVGRFYFYTAMEEALKAADAAYQFKLHNWNVPPACASKQPQRPQP